MDDVANQRIAAEEYLARLAESGKAKPSWWREFLQKIRMALGRIFGKPVTMTDREIGTLLARSARKMRKGMLNRRSRVEERYERGEMRDERGERKSSYTLENAVPSKEGYRVERVNENAGADLNEADAVICEKINQVFDPAEAPDSGFKKWVAQKIRDYEQNHPLTGRYETPALNGEVEIAGSSIRSIGNHGGPDAKYNLLPVVPDLLKKAVLVQTEAATRGGGITSRSHLLAAKVRYGENDRYVAVMVIHESNGKFYYDHSLLVLKEGELGKTRAEIERRNPAKTAGSYSHSAQVLKVTRQALLSSGFDEKYSKNIRFSLEAKGEKTGQDRPDGPDRSDGEVRRGTEGEDIRFSIDPELAELEQKYTRTKAWMTAPDGTHTALSEFQWLQTHKQSFKEYFGEWELAALDANIKRAWNDASFNFTYDFILSSRLAARLKELLGHEIKTLQIGTNLVRHIKKNHSSQDERKRGQKPMTPEDIVMLPYLLNNFDTAERDPKKDKKDSRAVCIQKRINGVAIVGTLEIGKNGMVVRTDYVKMSVAQMPMNKITSPGPNVQDGTDSVANVQREIKEIKRKIENSSKIVSSHGEPLLVYRGAEFDPLAQEPGKGIIRPEAYFTADPEYAKRYARNGGEVREYYLNIRRPFDIRDPECLKDLQRIYPDHEFQRGKSGALDWGEASIVDGEFLKENFGDKYDGIIYDEGGDQTDNGPKHRGISYVPLDGGTQVKSATDNIGTYDPENPDIRYMLAEYSEGEIGEIVKILKPYVGVFADRSKSEYQKYLADNGVDVSEEDAFSFASEAARVNNREARQRARKRRDDWIYENNPLWREVVDFCGGTEFKIRPSYRFAGEDFSGTWISADFVKYSEKRPQGKKESEASYRKYLDRREKALKHADGMASDQLAEAIARKWDRDPLDVEQEIIDYFRDLKKPDLYRSYTKFREESLLASKEERERAFDEWMQQEQARAEEEALEVLKKGKPITQEWIEENRKAYEALYRMIYDTGFRLG